MIEFETLQYPDTPAGQRQKVADLPQWIAAGWAVVSETVKPGESPGGCCAPSCCGPIYVKGKAKPGTITVTLQRDSVAAPGTINPEVAPQHPAVQAHRARVGHVSKVAHALTNVFLETPRPDTPIEEPQLRLPPMPEEPELQDSDFLGSISPEYRQQVEALNDAALRDYRAACARWEAMRDRLQLEHRQWQKDLVQGRFDDVSAMDRVLRHQLTGIKWPVPVTIEQARLDGARGEVQLDLVLPTESCVPNEWPFQTERGVDIQALSDVQRRGVYAALIHRVGLRVAGETFRALPNLEQITLSAYADRLDAAIGSPRSECLYSVRISRSDWQRINFGELEKIDPIACLDRFSPRKAMSANYTWTTVEALLPRSNLGGRLPETAPGESEPSAGPEPLAMRAMQAAVEAARQAAWERVVSLVLLIVLPPAGMLAVWAGNWSQRVKARLCLGGAVWSLILFAVPYSLWRVGVGEEHARVVEEARRDSTERAADSLSVVNLVARGRLATKADWMVTDDLIHRRGFQIPHTAGHEMAMQAVLDSVARLLRPNSDGWGAVDPAKTTLAGLRDPLSAPQVRQHKQLEQTILIQNKRIEAAARREAARELERQRREQAKLEREAARDMVTQRREYARNLESTYLDKGINARVTTRGSSATTLRIEWVLVSRVVAHQLAQDPILFESLRSLGFKRLEITDGYSETYSWKL
jgi:hypothetical protein